MNKQERQEYLAKRWTGEGWLPIIMELNKKLEAIDPNYTIDQVKEKFGGLRYYYTTHMRRWENIRLLGRWGWASAQRRNEKMYKLVQEAERECWRTCEVCGATENVFVKGPGWIKTVCPVHSAQ